MHSWSQVRQHVQLSSRKAPCAPASSRLCDRSYFTASDLLCGANNSFDRALRFSTCPRSSRHYRDLIQRTRNGNCAIDALCVARGSAPTQEYLKRERMELAEAMRDAETRKRFSGIGGKDAPIWQEMIDALMGPIEEKERKGVAPKTLKRERWLSDTMLPVWAALRQTQVVGLHKQRGLAVSYTLLPISAATGIEAPLRTAGLLFDDPPGTKGSEHFFAVTIDHAKPLPPVSTWLWGKNASAIMRKPTHGSLYQHLRFETWRNETGARLGDVAAASCDCPGPPSAARQQRP